ncbi:MAG: BON domain-containing protein [Actinomycetota bacterium]|nr:BON domain-containing protein [Actinomycetota bacterium]
MTMWPMPDFGSVGRDDPDSRLKAEVERRLRADGRTRGTVFNVDVQAGVVMLAGWTDRAGVRNTAAEIARGVPGARDVANGVVAAGEDPDPFFEIVRDVPRGRSRRTPGTAVALATCALLIPFVVTSRWVGAAMLCAAGLLLTDLVRRRRPRRTP